MQELGLRSLRLANLQGNVTNGLFCNMSAWP